MNNEAKAIAMVMDFHVAIEKWFCGEASLSADQLLQYFSSDFEMTGAAGKTMNYQELAAWLPKAKGAKPGMVIRVSPPEVFSTFCYTLVYYEETQEVGETLTTRRSSAIFRTEKYGLKWWRLTEEWIL
ncbi:hypothetical protein [Chitinophaga sp. Cy-1792]|uniref:hypothetical protein n=1 Tax=Chitinophaga sp. Cy-1792 TaxID=2608339 RepID=UPI001421B668|nr:hypothetical protein [Chitinophaga sp. Cy-1792]NIG55187.1 hypothetical protein [Chitinophaga sp. Cy-1792]